MSGAARAGHTHVIEYLLAEGCAWNESACRAAAVGDHLETLRYIRALGCPWDATALVSLATQAANLPLLRLLREEGAVFTENTMVQAAAHGHVAVCDYLFTQQCPLDAGTCIAAALEGQLGTLQWLLEHGCPYEAEVLWPAAANEGHITVMSYLQQTGVHASPMVLAVALCAAGAKQPSRSSAVAESTGR
jgi:hypothetical protein